MTSEETSEARSDVAEAVAASARTEDEDAGELDNPSEPPPAEDPAAAKDKDEDEEPPVVEKSMGDGGPRNETESGVRMMAWMRFESTRTTPHLASLPQPWSLLVENTVKTLALLLTLMPLGVASCARMM